MSSPYLRINGNLLKRKFDEEKKEKYCPGCKEIKPFQEFHNDRATYSGMSSRCKPCIKIRGQRYKKERKEKGTNYLHHKRNDLRKYRLSLDDYFNLIKNQGNKCAICLVEPNGKVGFFKVDHDHKTGHVRGLLCNNCNLALGNAKDSPTILLSMINYLRKNSWHM